MRTFEDDDPLFAPMLNALFAAFRGTAVMAGCEASATGISLDVAVAAGSVQINGVEVAVAAGAVTLDTGSTFDRYDLVTCDASGTLVVAKGSVERKCPTQPADTCLLAVVFVPAAATVIATGDVYDARMLASHVVAGQLTLAAGLILPESPFIILPDPTKAAKHLMISDDAETAGSWQTTWTLTKSLPPLPASVYGTANSVCVSYQHRSSHNDSTWTRIYVNGSPVGTERSHANTSYTTWDEVITGLKAGDVIQIYTHGQSGAVYQAYVRNLRVYGGALQSIPITPGIW